jgi:hypothetical protein
VIWNKWGSFYKSAVATNVHLLPVLCFFDLAARTNSIRRHGFCSNRFIASPEAITSMPNCFAGDEKALRLNVTIPYA